MTMLIFLRHGSLLDSSITLRSHALMTQKCQRMFMTCCSIRICKKPLFLVLIRYKYEVLKKKKLFLCSFTPVFFGHVTIAVTLQDFFLHFHNHILLTKKGENLEIENLQIGLVLQKLLSLKRCSVKYGNFCSGNYRV